VQVLDDGRHVAVEEDPVGADRVAGERRLAGVRHEPLDVVEDLLGGVGHLQPVVEHLHYRIIDVSSIKELARRWYPRAYFQSPQKNGGHRALADILESIDELRYYRAVLWPKGDGPSTVEAKEAAAAITADPTSARTAAKGTGSATA
jgi:hypothetical protein